MDPSQTAEIITLLYEATQGPAIPNKPAALNPTSGVTVKPSADSLHPGSGDFFYTGGP